MRARRSQKARHGGARDPISPQVAPSSSCAAELAARGSLVARAFPLRHAQAVAGAGDVRKVATRAQCCPLTIHHYGVYCGMTEKRTPTYDLDAFKAAFRSVERLRVTGTAVMTAAELGFGGREIVATIQTMRRSQFYKSMTSYPAHKDWQDVYYVPSSAGTLYVKFRADTASEFLLLSFKRKDDD
jgi:motility quorum-sensing regulator / GCU-specific mRNA interferase toxin